MLFPVTGYFGNGFEFIAVPWFEFSRYVRGIGQHGAKFRGSCAASGLWVTFFSFCSVVPDADVAHRNIPRCHDADSFFFARRKFEGNIKGGAGGIRIYRLDASYISPFDGIPGNREGIKPSAAEPAMVHDAVFLVGEDCERSAEEWFFLCFFV